MLIGEGGREKEREGEGEKFIRSIYYKWTRSSYIYIAVD